MFKFFKKNDFFVLISPTKGKLLDITKVPDQVFAQKMIGDGFAVVPEENNICSPCDGTIIQIFPTNHAFGIKTKDGLEILVHIGLETVELKGEGFKRLKDVGEKIKAGEAIINVNFDYLKQQNKEIITPVVITNMEKIEAIEKDFENPEKVLRLRIK